jgi:hypothetical protein
MVNLIWGKESSVLLKKDDNTGVNLGKNDCITFTRDGVEITAKILDFGFTGSGPPNKIFYLPYRPATNKWATNVVPRRSLEDESELNSIEKTECPPGDTEYGGKRRRSRRVRRTRRIRRSRKVRRY